jgi:hypothetical protein
MKLAKEERDIREIFLLTLSPIAYLPSPLNKRTHIMKLKNLRKKIRRLEKRLQEGPKKLAKLQQKLKAAETAKAMKPARKSAARATAARPASKSSTPIEKKSPAQTTKAKKPGTQKKAKRKLNLSPERRAQLAAAMKARWAAKRAAEAHPKTSSDNQHSASGPAPQAPESRPDGA